MKSRHAKAKLPLGCSMAAVELARETIKDTNGAPAQPYRSVDTVELLLRRGAITKEIAAAADRFQQAFRVAGADRLRARDMTRALGGGGSADLGAAAGQRRKCCFLVASARLPARLSGT